MMRILLGKTQIYKSYIENRTSSIIKDGVLPRQRYYVFQNWLHEITYFTFSKKCKNRNTDFHLPVF